MFPLGSNELRKGENWRYLAVYHQKVCMCLCISSFHAFPPCLASYLAFLCRPQECYTIPEEVLSPTRHDPPTFTSFSVSPTRPPDPKPPVPKKDLRLVGPPRRVVSIPPVGKDSKPTPAPKPENKSFVPPKSGATSSPSGLLSGSSSPEIVLTKIVGPDEKKMAACGILRATLAQEEEFDAIDDDRNESTDDEGQKTSGGPTQSEVATTDEKNKENTSKGSILNDDVTSKTTDQTTTDECLKLSDEGDRNGSASDGSDDSDEDILPSDCRVETLQVLKNVVESPSCESLNSILSNGVSGGDSRCSTLNQTESNAIKSNIDEYSSECCLQKSTDTPNSSSSKTRPSSLPANPIPKVEISSPVDPAETPFPPPSPQPGGVIPPVVITVTAATPTKSPPTPSLHPQTAQLEPADAGADATAQQTPIEEEKRNEEEGGSDEKDEVITIELQRQTSVNNKINISLAKQQPSEQQPANSDEQQPTNSTDAVPCAALPVSVTPSTQCYVTPCKGTCLFCNINSKGTCLL